MITRRDFLGASAGALLAGVPPAAARSRVIVAREPRGVDSARLLALLDRSLQAVYGRDNALDAWRLLARPQDTVGLKINCLAGRGASTSALLVEAISERLQQIGVRKILVFDRLDSDLESAGFAPGSRRGVRFAGNDKLGYEDDLSVFGSAGSRIAKAMASLCDVVINLPVLKDHGIVGVTMALKNLFGAIHNPNKYHINAGDPYVADVYALPEIRKKVALTICDAIRAQYEGGPSFMPQWGWAFNGLLVSRDPVALDTIGWQIIEQKRAEKGLKPLKRAGREPKYIATAADEVHRLGTNDPRQIERVDL